MPKYNVRRSRLTAREKELVKQRRARREAIAKAQGWDNLEDAARYRNSPALRRYKKRFVDEWQYDNLRDLKTSQRKAAVRFFKFRQKHPKTDAWDNPEFTDYMREMFGDEDVDQWISQYLGGSIATAAA